MKNRKIKWFSEPEAHDYPAALSYLTLIYEEEKAADFVSKLKKAKIIYFKSKDIFRASGLSLLGVSNSHVKKNQKKIKKKKSMSPLLLVRDKISGFKVIIADGYHRLCAVYHFNEDELIPCKIV